MKYQQILSISIMTALALTVSAVHAEPNELSPLAMANPSHALANNQPIQAPTASGEVQTTVVDESGNLKIIETKPQQSQVETNTTTTHPLPNDNMMPEKPNVPMTQAPMSSVPNIQEQNKK